MSMSLRKRMILLALLPVTLVAALLTTVFLWHSIDNLQQTMRTRGNAISRQMATAAEYGIFSGQRASLLSEKRVFFRQPRNSPEVSFSEDDCTN